MPDDHNDNNSQTPREPKIPGMPGGKKPHAYGLAVFYFGLRASGLRLL